MKKIKYAQVRLFDRSNLYLWAITQQYPENSELVAICDSNPRFVELRQIMVRAIGSDPACYGLEDFDQMIIE